MIGVLNKCIEKSQSHNTNAYLSLSERLFEADLLDAVPNTGASYKKKKRSLVSWLLGRKRKKLARDTRMVYVIKDDK